MKTFEEFIQQEHPEIMEVFDFVKGLFGKHKTPHEKITGRKPVTRGSAIGDKMDQYADENAAALKKKREEEQRNSSTRYSKKE